MAADTLTLPAPAKLNLFLHITGRRADGYHLLQTVFALLELGDRLAFSPADTLSLHAPEELAGPDNLVLRAARLLQEETGCRAGADIRLEKTLPAGGGLGGGSSDAATTLLALNHLWQTGLSTDDLASLGLRLGADVPVFVQGRNAWAEGVGEQLTFIDLPTQDYLVIDPGVSVPTAGIFSDPQLTRDNPKSTLAAFLEPGSEDAFSNVCEPVARRLYGEIDKACRWLESKVGNSRMTGTGACVFARIDNRAQGEALIRELPPDWTGFATRSVNRSPALEALDTLRQNRQTDTRT
jgi:4-diphosphocytidyl-2-C-methyl-D-erythritol kinase